jgi:hypothetical protein
LVEAIVRAEFPGVTISRRGDPKSAVALGATNLMATPSTATHDAEAAVAATLDQPGPPPAPDPTSDVTPQRAPRPAAPVSVPGASAAPPTVRPDGTSPATSRPDAGSDARARGRSLMVGGFLAVLAVSGLVVAAVLSQGDENGTGGVPSTATPTIVANSGEGGEDPSTTPAVGAEAALLTSDDLVMRDGLTGWGREAFPDGDAVGLASLDVNNEFCGAPQPDGAQNVASVWFDRVDDNENLSAIAHQVVVFDRTTSASAWVGGVFDQFEACVQGGANESTITLADGNDYVATFTTVGLSPEFQEGDCLGRLTNAVYRAFDPADADPSVSDPVFVQIHRIRSCGKNVSILTSRTTVEASAAEDLFLGVLEGRAFELIDALPET